MTERWKAVCKQWDNHVKNTSAPMPINPKNNNPYTKSPEALKLSNILLV